MGKITPNQAAKLLGVSKSQIKTLEKQGIIHSIHGTEGSTFYSPEEITRIRSRQGLSLSQEAAQVGIQIQRKLVSSVTTTQKVLMLAGGTLSGYALLIATFTVLFTVSPLKTAEWLGLTNLPAVTLENEKVLGASINAPKQASPIQTILQPIGKVSLGLVKNISPSSYAQVSKVTVLDLNDVLAFDDTGALAPVVPLNLAASALSEVGSSELVSNLNSQYLQGKQPGTNVGDIAIVGETTPSNTDTLADVTARGGTTQTPLVLATINGLTITNNGDNTLAITSGKTLASNNSLTFSGSDGTTITFQGSDTYVGRTTSDTLTNKTIAAGSNTISGLTNSNLSGSAGITDANLATVSTAGKVSGSALQLSSSGGLTNNSGISLLTSCSNGQVLAWDNTASSWACSTAGSGGGVTLLNSLSGSLTIAGGGINAASVLGSTITITGTEADTLATVTGRGATTTTALTLSNVGNAITAGTLTTTGGTINGTTIGATSPSTGVFTTINGLTITNNGTNTLAIATGKTLTASNSLTFTGTDGTSFAFPTTSDDIVGRTVSQTLTGKTITAGSNTISGLTNTNLSGTAGITNANLANSSITTAGNSGSGSVSLGGGLTFTGSGITNIVASGSTLTVTSTEADTLASVTGRGATTTTSISTSGGATITSDGTLTASNGLTLTTGALNLAGTSGALTLSGLSSSSISTATSGNLSLTTGTTGNITVDSGTTGNVNIGTGTSGKTINIGTDNTTKDTINLGSALDDVAITGDQWSVTNAGVLTVASCTGCGGTAKNVVKGTDENVPSGTTLQDDDALTFAVGSGETWVFQFNIQVSNSSSAVPDWKAAILGASGWTCSYAMHGEGPGTSRILNVQGTDCDDAPTAVADNGIASDAGVPYEVILQGSITTTSAGSVTLQWAPNTSGSLTVKAGSFVIAQKVGGADLAEVYYTKDASIRPGDVVSLDSSIIAGVKKSTKAYDPQILGIISTQPGLLLGDGANTHDIPVMLALAGRVPVRVSTENGAILAGDDLTSSSTPGVAMKTTKAGAIIGTAMTAFDGEGIGTVVVFVKDGSSVGSSSEEIGVLTQWLGGSSNTFGDQEDTQIDIEEAASSSAQPKASNLIETKISDQITKTIASFIKNLVEFFGSVIFHSDVTFIGRPTFNKDTAGHARVMAGETQINVIFEKEYVQKPVVTISANLEEGVNANGIPAYAVYDLSTKGFKIKLSGESSSDLNFSWIALAVSGGVPATTPSPTPQPTPDESVVNEPVPAEPENETATSSANTP